MIREGVREGISREGAMDQRSREGIYLHLTEHNITELLLLYIHIVIFHTHIYCLLIYCFQTSLPTHWGFKQLITRSWNDFDPQKKFSNA